MTRKNKILFIDDGKNNQGDLRIETLKYIKIDYPAIVTLSSNIKEYFDFGDGSGESCRLLFDSNEYMYIFIHHSFNDPTLLPSNGLDLLKSHLEPHTLKPFSGSASGDEVYSRADVYKLFREFIEYYVRYRRWVPYCFINSEYKKILAQDIFEDFKEIAEQGKNTAMQSSTYIELIHYLNDQLGYCEIDESLDIFGVIQSIDNQISKL